MKTMTKVRYGFIAALITTLIFLTCVYNVTHDRPEKIDVYPYVERDLNFTTSTPESNFPHVVKGFRRKISSADSDNFKSNRVKVEFSPSSFSKITSSIQFKKNYPEVNEVLPGSPFEYLSLILDTVEEDICDPNATFIIAVVPSAVNNSIQRDFIRNSWADKNLQEYTKLRAVFLLGVTKDQQLQIKIDQEAQKYKDILQINFLDSYRNLTYKTIAALLWVSENCKYIPWVLKIDDDVILNPFNLRVFLENELRSDASPTKILGRVRAHGSPFRSGKWKITKDEYPGKYYPSFVLGSAYIIGRNAVERLINEAIKTPYFPLEDVFTTGMCAKKAKIGNKNIEKSHFATSGKTRSFKTLYRGKTVFMVGQKMSTRKNLWRSILKYKPPLR